jgi:hypothetical protein
MASIAFSNSAIRSGSTPGKRLVPYAEWPLLLGL